MPHFEVVKKYIDKPESIILPERKTKGSAGYDFAVAEDIIVPSYFGSLMRKFPIDTGSIYTLKDVAEFTKREGVKPTLVPTGVKCIMGNDYYLQLSVRSSLPLKSWLILANGCGIIDADYANNPDNDGHIYFQLINLFSEDILLQKGDIIGQGIIQKYVTVNNDTASGERIGGFGSTGG